MTDRMIEAPPEVKKKFKKLMAKTEREVLKIIYRQTPSQTGRLKR